MYAGDTPVVHLVGIDPDNPEGLYDYLGEQEVAFLDGSGSIDHLAFSATDPDNHKTASDEIHCKNHKLQKTHLHPSLFQLHPE